MIKVGRCLGGCGLPMELILSDNKISNLKIIMDWFSCFNVIIWDPVLLYEEYFTRAITELLK